MKVAIIIPGLHKFLPYIDLYIDTLSKLNIEYRIISWDRNNLNKNYDSYTFELKSSMRKNALLRYYDYCKFSRFVNNKINNEVFDIIIICTIAPAIFLQQSLLTKYKYRYIIDIRDYSPLVSFMKRNLQNILNGSLMNIISSHGFKQWLPQDIEYNICHNIPLNNETNSHFLKEHNNNVYQVLSIGYFQNYKATKNIVDKLGNDKRFLLKFSGAGEALEKLKLFCVKYKIENVEFSGIYEKKDEDQIYRSSDIINIFHLNDIGFKTLLTNKFYRAIKNNKPILTRAGTLQGEYTRKYRIGLCIDMKNNNFSDALFNYLSNIDIGDLSNNCSKCYNDVLEEQNILINKISDIFNNFKNKNK